VSGRVILVHPGQGGAAFQRFDSMSLQILLGTGVSCDFLRRSRP
jgi:hypothetical protein